MKRAACLLVSLTIAGAAAAQTAAADSALLASLSDAERYTAPGVSLLVESGALAPGEAETFAHTMSAGVAEIVSVLGAGLDRARYGTDTIHVVISPRVTISHVYGAYEHMRHPHPYLFLSSEKVRDGSAPYLHEATHLLAWRFGSLSLREGFASYVEARVSAAMGIESPALFGIRDNADADRRAAEMAGGPAAAEVLPYIGVAGTPPARITSSQDRRTRAAFYVLSQSFVAYLYETLGAAGFQSVYSASDPAPEILARTGRALDEARSAWLAGLLRPAAATLGGPTPR